MPKPRLAQHHVALDCLRYKRNWDRFHRFVSVIWLPAPAQKVFNSILTFHERHPNLKEASFPAIEAILSETTDDDVDLSSIRRAAKAGHEVAEKSFTRWVKEHLCADAIAVHQSTQDPMKGVPELINKLEKIEKVTSINLAGYHYLSTSPAKRLSLSKPDVRIPTPLPGLTKLYRGGISAPDLITLMGVTDAGKTLLSCAWGAAAIRVGFRVLHVTTETHPEAVASRYDCALLGAGVRWIRRHTDILQRTHQRLRQYGGALVIQDYTSIQATIADVTKAIDSFLLTYGRLDLIIVDRADLLTSLSGKKDYGSFATLWQSIRRLCTEYYVPVIATTQVNREGSSVDGANTKKLHVAESWAKVCDADEVLALGASDEEIRNQIVTIKILKTKKLGGYGRDFVCKVDRVRCSMAETSNWGHRSKPNA